ncbi:hypothetical protein YDYSY3_22300 [Paenibacillus chitinolyticus]|uniref:hypothetical protein n=1 Tax=Paenibacillus chitinolyticus TaxID=79263 RepID=UPI0026E4C658|nr:hypothetical protein [Paenibacillus chitinolyticus]GKS11230.1 hypothetical protein YDYSY3_22300 [Paenibacillus chitinolyticus]
MYEIIQNDSEVTKLIFSHYSNGFADGIGLTLQQKFDINAEFDIVPNTKQMIVFCPRSN